MSKDYKNDMTTYLTEERFNKWWNKKNNRYKKILETLDVFTYEQISAIFKGENHILKFFWYKLLTRGGMPASGFDCDKAFFGKIPPFKPSKSVNDWQRKRNDLVPDTANSFTSLFKVFLALYLPDIFLTNQYKGEGKVRFTATWPENILSKRKEHNNDSYAVFKSKYNNLKKRYEKKAVDNQLKLFSYLILFQEDLFRQLNEKCDNRVLQSMQDFAKLTHTPGNFILVKDNRGKFNLYGDFMDLFVEMQDEDFIKGQHLSMYRKVLFNRQGEGQLFPFDKVSFTICINNINKNIILRERELKYD